MMQSCASAAKLQGGGPILNRGSKAMCKVGLPPPRTVICASPSQESQAQKLNHLCPHAFIMPPGERADLPELLRWSLDAKAQ